MALASGTRLGPYEIISPLGAGGMGEVYRARDTRLGRDVAVKVLATKAAATDELRARFEREARAVAALNHPHICTLHDVGREGSTDYLVMELVEGETLAARLQRGLLPVHETLLLGSQIADALQSAHRAGLMHRDLKPGNIMLTKSGAKLMDFGLARTLRSPIGADVASRMTTQSAPITSEGQLVGTFHYMAPEQLEGREADARSDIWALGATIYEMATGTRAFEGMTTASLISAIMRDEPRALRELVPLTLPALDRLILTCLAKDPNERWQSAGDVARELRWIASGDSSSGVKGSPPAAAVPGVKSAHPRRWIAWSAGSVLAVVLAVGGAMRLGNLGSVGSPDSVVRAEIVFGMSGQSVLQRYNMALSPDGRTLAVVVADSGATSTIIYLRRIGERDATTLRGSEGAQMPFWSPDSRNIAFVSSEGRLVRLGLEGGLPQTICRVPDFAGGSWGRGGWIVFASGTGPVMRVSENGGTPSAVTRIDSALHEISHVWPDFLPDGRHFTFAVTPEVAPSSFEIRVGSVDGEKTHPLMRAHHAPRCDGRDWLIFARDRALFAQRVEASGRALIGDPVPLPDAPERSGDPMDPLVSVTSRFAAYIPSDDRLVAACWYDRHGLPGRMVAKLEPHAIAPIISSSGRLAVARRVQGGETWLISLDLQTGAQRRLTSPEQWNSWPIWSARGDHVIYMSGTKSGVATVREMDPLDPSTHRDLYTSTVECWPVFQTPDQTRVMLGGAFTKSSVDLVSVALAAGTANSYAATSADETDAVLLSDGHTVALVSNPTGTPEIYLDTFPVRSQAIKITSNGCELSTGGVRHALWLVGDELIYIAANERTVRSIRLEHAGGRWIVRDDEPLFDIPYDCRGICPAPDGKKFLVLVPDGAPRSPSVALVENWKSALGH